MRKAVLVSFSLLFVSVFLIGVVTEPVSALSYYNWVRNPSFEYNTNLIEDAGFESGLENQGNLYGNWSTEASSEITTQYANGGIWCAESNITNGAVWYNFTEPILGADVEAFSCYALCFGGSNDFRVRVYYSDDSYDYDDFTDAGLIWVFEDDLIDVIDTMKYVVAFNVEAISSYAYWFDDFVFTVYDGSSGESQLSVGYNTEPWYFSIGADWDNPNQINEVVEYSNFGDNSLQFNIDESGESTYVLTQVIDWLDSDSVHFLDMYVLMDVADTCEINVLVFYDGGDSSTKHYDYTGTGSYQQINFGNNWIYDDRIITNLCIWFDEVDGTVLYLDDVGLWCDLPKGQSRFDYTISPMPINGYNGFTVNLYYGVQYRFYCQLTTYEGYENENGTFSVTHRSGVVNGTVLNGAFNFLIPVRTGTSDSSEYVGITMVTDDEVIQVTISVTWRYSGSPYEQSGGTEGSESVTDSVDFWNYIVFFAIMFAPPAIVAGAGAKDGWGAQGFLVTLGITTIAGVMYLQLPFYVVFLVGIGMAIMLFTMIRKG